MNYNGDLFMSLAVEVEAQGGQLLEGICKPKAIRMKLPNSRGEMRTKDILTTGCRNESRFEVPYDPAASIEEALEQGQFIRSEGDKGSGTVVACAVDDDMASWPRFQHILKEQ